MTSQPPLLDLVEAEKWYGSRRVLQISRLSVTSGDRILLLGENGSGKSTLLRVLAGVSAPTKGQYTRSPAYKRMRIGYVPQLGGLYYDLTIRENFQVFCRVHGAASPEAPEDHWFVAETPLRLYMDTPVAQLSGGFQKLTMLACNIIIKPDGLFLDEPSSDLDDAHVRHLHDALQLAESGLEFIVMSTHDEAFKDIASRHVLLRDGRLA